MLRATPTRHSVRVLEFVPVSPDRPAGRLPRSIVTLPREGPRFPHQGGESEGRFTQTCVATN